MQELRIEQIKVYLMNCEQIEKLIWLPIMFIKRSLSRQCKTQTIYIIGPNDEQRILIISLEELANE